MTSTELTILFLQLSIMLISAMALAALVRRLNHPPIVGELLAGILLGQTVLGYLAPSAFDWLFLQHAAVIPAREALILTGMLFFLFSTGMEVDLSMIQGRVWGLFLVSSLGILIPFGLGAGTVLAFPNFWNAPESSNQFQLALFMGTALSISALPIIARILQDLNLLDKEIGSVILTSAVLNDILGWTIFAASLNMMQSNGEQANLGKILGSLGLALVLIWGMSRWLARPLINRSRSISGEYIGIVAACILAAAALAEWLGIHPIFGAFLVGVALGKSRTNKTEAEEREVINKFASRFFAPLYFVSVGLKVNFAENFDLGLVLLVLLIAILGKVIGGGLGARLSGFDARTSLAIGFGLNARGAIEIILASVALQHGVIDQRIFVALVVMALVTSMISAPALKHLLPRESGRT